MILACHAGGTGSIPGQCSHIFYLKSGVNITKDVSKSASYACVIKPRRSRSCSAFDLQLRLAQSALGPR